MSASECKSESIVVDSGSNLASAAAEGSNATKVRNFSAGWASLGSSQSTSTSSTSTTEPTTVLPKGSLDEDFETYFHLPLPMDSFPRFNLRCDQYTFDRLASIHIAPFKRKVLAANELSPPKRRRSDYDAELQENCESDDR